MEQIKETVGAVLSESLKKVPQTSTKICSKHKTALTIRRVNTTPGNHMDLPYCLACEAEEQEATALEAKRRDMGRINRIMKGDFMNIPARFKDAVVKDLPKIDGESILLTGPCGTGKSYMAAALAKEIAIADTSFHGDWVNFQELAIEIKTSFRDDVRSMDEILADVIHWDFLILDDICTAKPTESAIESLYMIVNQRYERMMQTIYTTNLSIGEISGIYGDRIASRLAACKLIKLDGKDRRLA